MADGVNDRHARFYRGAFYVKREDASVGAFCTWTSAGAGNAEMQISELDEYQRTADRGFISHERRAEWCEVWPHPEDMKRFTPWGDPRKTMTVTLGRDGWAELDQLRRDVDELKNPPIPWRELGTFRIDIYTTGSLHHPSATVTHKPTQIVESNNETVSANRNADLAHARIVERIATAGTCPCCHEVECDPGCACAYIRERHSE